jgi:hypothetical protein
MFAFRPWSIGHLAGRTQRQCRSHRRTQQNHFHASSVLLGRQHDNVAEEVLFEGMPRKSSRGEMLYRPPPYICFARPVQPGAAGGDFRLAANREWRALKLPKERRFLIRGPRSGGDAAGSVLGPLAVTASGSHPRPKGIAELPSPNSKLLSHRAPPLPSETMQKKRGRRG